MQHITVTSITGVPPGPHVLISAPSLEAALKEIERNHPGARPEVVYQFRDLYYFAPGEVKREVTE